jgi:CRP-like cAMP-binding protein
LTVLLSPAILGADARATVPIVQIGLLRSMPLFRPLPAPELESVARSMEPLEVAAGKVMIREGDPGDAFYLVADGQVTVSTAAGFTAVHGRGDGFGEIALLNDTPRTATVTAATEASLYRLAREDFLQAVTGVADVHRAARRLAADRLAEHAI